MESVKVFFAIILGLALLAYVIVVIMGTLNNSTLMPRNTLSSSSVNETGWLNGSGYSLTFRTLEGFTPTLVNIVNGTQVVAIANGSIVNGVIRNTTSITWPLANITYSYTYDDQNVINSRNILSNTSSGVSGFFSNVSPVYAILAILVIILVLVVLVRVVGNSTNTQGSSSVL